MKKIIKALHKLQWRVRYTWIFCRRVSFAEVELWWGWSATDYDEFSHLSTPAESVQEEIYAMAASQ